MFVYTQVTLVVIDAGEMILVATGRMFCMALAIFVQMECSVTHGAHIATDSCNAMMIDCLID